MNKRKKDLEEISRLQGILDDFKKENFPHGLKECELCCQIPATKKEKNTYLCGACFTKLEES